MRDVSEDNKNDFFFFAENASNGGEGEKIETKKMRELIERKKYVLERK